MGCNSIRMTHNPPAPEVLDLCDRYGILVIDELFDIWKRQKVDKVWGYHRYWNEWMAKDVRNFVMRDRNHPCVIASSIPFLVSDSLADAVASMNCSLSMSYRRAVASM